MKVHVLYLGVDYSCLFVHKVLGGSSGLNKFRMVSPFFINMVHIGQLIEKELHKQERSVTWFANKLCYERTNVYSIFKRESIDTALLVRISKILHHNFFVYYNEEIIGRDLSSTEV